MNEDYTHQEYQGLIADGCPHCGEALQIKRGKYGEFLACSDWCGYTKSVPGKSYFPPKAKECSKCGGSGFLPFVKNGKVIPHTRIDCECKLSEHSEYFDLVRAEDFDFACSYSQRACQAEKYDGISLPPLAKPESYEVYVDGREN